MSDSYKIESTSNQSAVVNEEEPIVLSVSDSGTHRLILRPTIVRHSTSSQPQLKFSFYKQRKNKADDWENEPEPNIQLKAGEIRSLKLDTREMNLILKHMEYLQQLLSEYGFPMGEKDYVIAPKKQVILIKDWRKAKALKTLIKDNPKDIWQEIIESDNSLANLLAENKINEIRKKALLEFESNIKNTENDEKHWQKFFEENTWIFGYGLNYQFLELEIDQPNYGGTDISGSGAQRGDYLMATASSNSRFTVLVEIKKPYTSLLGGNQYRNGAWDLDKELTGAVTQVQANCSTWVKSSEQPNNIDKLDSNTYTVEPKGVIVIGNTDQFNDNDRSRSRTKRETFERFRRNINNPEIITFDELLERAKFIVNSDTKRLGEEDD